MQQVILDHSVNDQSVAPEQLLPLVYEALKDLARQRMALERPGHTLQATALVNEAYLRLMTRNIRWASPAQFYYAAAQAMRRILVEHARAAGTLNAAEMSNVFPLICSIWPKKPAATRFWRWTKRFVA